MQPRARCSSHHIGAGHPCRGYFYGFAHLIGVLGGGQCAGVAAGRAGIDGQRDAVARRVLQPELLADVEEGRAAAHPCLVGIVFHAHGGDPQRQVFQSVAFLAQESAGGLLVHLAALDVQVGGVVDAGDEHEAGLLGDARFELVSYPAQVGRVDVQYLVQEVATVFAEGDKVVASALHALGVVFRQIQAAGGVETEGAGHAQGFVDVGREVAEVEDGLAAGQGRVDPQGVLRFSLARKHDQIGSGLLVGGSAPVVQVQFLVQQGLFVVR